MGERQIRRNGAGRVRRMGVVMALALALALALGAARCASSTTSTGVGSGTPQAAQQCGTVNRGGPVEATAAPGGDQHALDCFWHAHTACAPATLVYTFSGVDATTTHTFTIAKGASGCSVSDQVHTWINTRTRDYGAVPCSGVRQVGSGLEIDGCGSFGDVTISAS